MRKKNEEHLLSVCGKGKLIVIKRTFVKIVGEFHNLSRKKRSQGYGQGCCQDTVI
jgi:hypothetical protein